MIKTEKDTENKLTEKVTLPAVGTVHVKAPTFDGRCHWATYLRQLEAAACANNRTEKDKAVSLVLALKGPTAELLQKVPPDSQNTYAELIKALELRYGDKHLRDVYCSQLRARRQHSGESLQEFEASIEKLIRLAYPEEPEIFERVLRRRRCLLYTSSTSVNPAEIFIQDF